MKRAVHLIFSVVFLVLILQSCSANKSLMKIQFENNVISGQIIRLDSVPAKFHPLDTIGTCDQIFPSYPNPFSPTTSVDFNVFNDDTVSIKFFDLYGSLLNEPFRGFLMRGKYLLKLSAYNLNTGVYFVTFCNGNKGYIRKILII